MNNNALVRLFAESSFKTLPDGKRVLLDGILKPNYYLILDQNAEHRLYQKIFGVHLFFSVLMLLNFLAFLVVLDRFIGLIIFGIVLVLLVLELIAHSAVIRKEVHNLRKIDLPREITYFYDNFMSKVNAGLNGSLPSHEIIAYLDIPNIDDKIILLNPKEVFPNVLRCRLDGSIRWQAELPTKTNDVYTNIEWKDQKLYAFSRSNQSIVLDENTGRILSAESAIG